MTFFSHLLHDVVSFDEVLARNEEARWSRLLDQIEERDAMDDTVIDPYDDGDED